VLRASRGRSFLENGGRDLVPAGSQFCGFLPDVSPEELNRHLAPALSFKLAERVERLDYLCASVDFVAFCFLSGGLSLFLHGPNVANPSHKRNIKSDMTRPDDDLSNFPSVKLATYRPSFRVMSTKRRIHVTLPEPLSDALEALAKLEGRSVSELLEEITRDSLRQRNLLPSPTAQQLLDEMRKRK
jgi:hypothetical protein